MNLLHPKALRVSNLMEGFLEEMRERNLRNVMEFHKQSQQSTHNRKAANYVAGDRNLVLMRPVKTESFERNTLQEGEAVSTAAPLKQPVPGYAVAMALGFTIAAGVFGLAFGLYWLLRIYL